MGVGPGIQNKRRNEMKENNWVEILLESAGVIVMLLVLYVLWAMAAVV